MKILQLFTLVLFFSNLLSNAQKLELGKVSIQELQEKKHPLDSTAVAAFLFNKAKTSFKYLKTGFYLEHEYSIRIKIYKKEGFDWATKKVNHYIAYKEINKDYVTFSDCITYNLVDGKIEKTKLKSEGIFTTKINEYFNQAAITMPNVKVGSVIEYKYTITSEYINNFPDFDFQQNIPVNYAEYLTEIPEFFIYKQVTKGLQKIKTEEKLGFGYQNFTNSNNQGVNVDYRQINTIHILDNIPSLKNEDFIDNLENYRSSIGYELEQTRFYEVPIKQYSETWENVAKNIFEDKRFGAELKENEYHLNSLNVILKDKKEPLERLNTIFKFVQNKMNWNNQNAIFTEKGVVKAFEEGSGNAAEINFILIAMLNHAGLNANPVLISTKDNGIAVYPTRTAFNFVIVSVEIDGKFILLDATSTFAAVNVLPIKNLNWTGRLIRLDGSSNEIDLISDTKSIENIKLKAIIESNGIISGKTQIQKDKFNAFNFRQNYANLNIDNYIEQLESIYNRIEISDYQIENKLTNLEKSVTETFVYKTDNEIEIINNKIYFRPLLYYSLSQNPFKQNERTLPIDFEFMKEKSITVSIEIPDGYDIETMPNSINIASPENVFTYKYSILKNNNLIQVLTSFNINKTIIPADFYEITKDFYKQMIEKQNEKIVLIKK